MSFLMYQRSDPRTKDWLPLTTQQVRLRNVIQIVGVNIETSRLLGSPRPKSPGGKNAANNPNNNNEAEDEEIYFTLHSRPMSVPFYTSDKLKMEKLIDRTKTRILTWLEIEPRDISEAVRLSMSGFTICVWSSLNGQQKTIVSWGVFFQGLYHLGPKQEWNYKDFKANTLIFRTPFGYFTSLESLIKSPTNAQRFVYLPVHKILCRPSYTVKNLATLHGVQRSLLEEVDAARQLKSNIILFGYSPEFNSGVKSNSPTNAITLHSSQLVNEKIVARMQQGKRKLVLKEELQNLRQKINILREEKSKALHRVSTLKADKMSYEVNNNSLDLLSRMQSLGREKSRLFQIKVLVQERKRLLTDMSSKLFIRRKQLISELLLIYPVSLVEGSKRYSINEVQLPNAEDYGSEGGAQISVALGYTAHMVGMLSFFLGVPLRYPISHFGSRSRITDHITMQIPDKEREFPLYFRSKEDVYSKYGVYLLNKNVAQLRWYCGLSTSDLRATLPNLLNLLQTRLTIPGWPPTPGEMLEIAQELTEEVDEQLCRSESSLSLDKGLDQIDQRDRGIENAWFRSSFSDLECAGGHVVPSGEVRHSRAQDRFLSGWRKKTYESEDIDSNWLINSLNLDFDGGRRLSTSSNSSLTAFNNRLMQPMIFLNDDGLGFPQSRRFGRIERGGQGDKLAVPNDSVSLPAAANTSTPNENMSQVENHIKQLERKRSFCKDHHLQDSRGRRHSSDPPSTLEKQAFEISFKERFDDHGADFMRRMSLVEMEHNRNKSPEGGGAHEDVKEENESEEDASSLRVENDNDNNFEVSVSERELLFSKAESPAHLKTKYFDHSSGDERGDTPSPSFIRKPSRQQVDVDTSTISSINDSIEQLTQNILNLKSVPTDTDAISATAASEPEPPPETQGLLSNVNEPPDTTLKLAETLSPPSNTDASSSANERLVPLKLDVHTDTNLNSNLLASEQEPSFSQSQTTICDNDNDIISTSCTSTTSQDSDTDENSLWFRTEALVTNTKSFNMVKRRMSKN